RTSLKTSLATSPRTKLSAAARSRARAASTSGRRTTCPARRPAESIRTAPGRRARISTTTSRRARAARLSIRAASYSGNCASRGRDRNRSSRYLFHPVQTVRVVVVDDHDVLRLGVLDFVDSLPGYRVVGEAASARAAFETIEATKPDVVLMDIALPGMDGVVATREIRRRAPNTRIVVLTAHKHTHDVRDAIAAGAIGYVL